VLVGLDVLQIYLALLDHVLMHLLAVPASAGQPGGHGAFIQTKGGHNRWEWTAMAQQGENDSPHVRRRVQPVAWRARGGHDGATAGLAAITLFPLAMHHGVALPQLSSSTAGGMVAELDLQVHRWPPVDEILQSRAITSGRMPEGPAFFQDITHSPRLSGVVPLLESTTLNRDVRTATIKGLCYRCSGNVSWPIRLQ
jgi:hypothetical protein